MDSSKLSLEELAELAKSDDMDSFSEWFRWANIRPGSQYIPLKWLYNNYIEKGYFPLDFCDFCDKLSTAMGNRKGFTFNFGSPLVSLYTEYTFEKKKDKFKKVPPPKPRRKL